MSRDCFISYIAYTDGERATNVTHLNPTRMPRACSRRSPTGAFNDRFASRKRPLGLSTRQFRRAVMCNSLCACVQSSYSQACPSTTPVNCWRPGTSAGTSSSCNSRTLSHRRRLMSSACCCFQRIK